jgi:hypothetical protein
VALEEAPVKLCISLDNKILLLFVCRLFSSLYKFFYLSKSLGFFEFVVVTDFSNFSTVRMRHLWKTVQIQKESSTAHQVRVPERAELCVHVLSVQIKNKRKLENAHDQYSHEVAQVVVQ